MPFKVLFLSLIILSCATENSQVVSRKESPPFLKRYKNKNKELIYIAIKSVGSVDEVTKSLIQTTIKKFDPEIIVTKYPVEGVHRLETDLSQCELGQGCSASAWSCFLAKPRGIPCLSGEPFHSAILKRSRSLKVNSDEILFLYTFRSLVKTMKGKKSPLEGLDKILEEEKKVLNMVSALDEKEFIRMYRDKMNSQTILVGKKEILPKADGNYIQQLAKLVQDSEDQLILEKIEKEQIEHERVLVIYGIEHFERHLNPLEDFFSSHLP